MSQRGGVDSGGGGVLVLTKANILMQGCHKHKAQGSLKSP